MKSSWRTHSSNQGNILLPSFYPFTIITNSKYVIDGLMTHLRTWEDNGLIGIENTQLFKRAAYLLQRRTTATSFKWVKGHRGNLENEESNKLAKEGANKGEPDYLPWTSQLSTT